MAALGERKNKPNKFSIRKMSEDIIEHDTYVLRNLSPSTDLSQIRCDLEEKGYRVISIRNAKNHATGSFSPVFFVKLFKSPFNQTILELKYVAQQVIKVENYLQGPDLPRCTTCQGLDHTWENCNNSVVCAYCSYSHPTCMCKNAKIAPPTCSRCGECHPSNYKGCKVYRKMALLKALSDKSKEIGRQAISFNSKVTVLEKSITFTNDSISAVKNSIASANCVTSSVSVTYARRLITSSCKITSSSKEVNAVRNTTINPVDKQIISDKKSITPRRATSSSNNWTTSASYSPNNSTTYASRSVTSANSSFGSSHSWIPSVSSWTSAAYDSIASPSSSITYGRSSRPHASSTITSSNSLKNSSHTWIPSVTSWTTPTHDSIASLSNSITHARSSSTYTSSSKTSSNSLKNSSHTWIPSVTSWTTPTHDSIASLSNSITHARNSSTYASSSKTSSNCLIDPSHIWTTSPSSLVQGWPSMKRAKPINVSHPSELSKPSMPNSYTNDLLKEWPRIVSDVNDYSGAAPVHDSITSLSNSITHACSSSTQASSSITSSNSLVNSTRIRTTLAGSSVQGLPSRTSAKPVNVPQASEFSRPSMSNFNKNDFLKEWPRIVSDVNDYSGAAPVHDSITSLSSSTTHACSSSTQASSSITSSNCLIDPSHIWTNSTSSLVQGWPSMKRAKPVNVSHPSELSKPSMPNSYTNDFLKEWPRIVSDVNDYSGAAPVHDSITSLSNSITHACSSSTQASSSITSSNSLVNSTRIRTTLAGSSVQGLPSRTSAKPVNVPQASEFSRPSMSNFNKNDFLKEWPRIVSDVNDYSGAAPVHDSITSLSSSTTHACSSSTQASSSITSSNCLIDPSHIWTNSTSSLVQGWPSMKRAKPVNVSHPSELSKPSMPNSYTNDFLKEWPRIVSDVNDYSGAAPVHDSITSLSNSITHACSSSTQASSSITSSNSLVNSTRIRTTLAGSSVQGLPSRTSAKPVNVPQASEFSRPSMSNFNKNDFLKEWPRIVSDVNDYSGAAPVHDSITSLSSSTTHACSSSTQASSSITSSNCLIDPSHIWTNSTSSLVQGWPSMKRAKPVNVSHPSELSKPSMPNFYTDDFLKEWPKIVSDVNDYSGAAPVHDSITSLSSSITHVCSSSTQASSSITSSNSLVNSTRIRTTLAGSSVQGLPSRTSAKPVNVPQASEFSRPSMSNFNKNDFLKEWPSISSEINDYFGITPAYDSIISPGNLIPHTRSSSTHASSSIPSSNGSVISDIDSVHTASDWTTSVCSTLISLDNSSTYISSSSKCASISSASVSSSSACASISSASVSSSGVSASISTDSSCSEIASTSNLITLSSGNIIPHPQPWISSCVNNSLVTHRAMLSLDKAFMRPSVTSGRQVNVADSSGFSRPSLLNFDEIDFKKQQRISADVNDHFGTMNKDLYKKLLDD